MQSMNRNSIPAFTNTSVSLAILTISLLQQVVMKSIPQDPKVISGSISLKKPIFPTIVIAITDLIIRFMPKISPYQGPDAEPCWINIEFPGYKGNLHLTYKTLHNDLAKYVEDIRTLAYKHIIKADDIIEKPVSFPDRKVYGLIYDIQGKYSLIYEFLPDRQHAEFSERGLVFQCNTQQRFPGTGYPVFFRGY